MVDAKTHRGVLDHLPYRQCLAAVAHVVARPKPGKALAGVVVRALLGKDDDRAVAVGKGRPAGAAGILLNSLAATVQGDDEGGSA
jgi:hypothetical protein